MRLGKDSRGHARMRTARAAIFCRTRISVLLKVFECEPLQLRLAANMFPESGFQSEFLNEFYVMDVILSWAPLPATSTGLLCRPRQPAMGGQRVVVMPIAMCFVTSCRVTRKMMTPVWTIDIGPQSYSFLSVGCFTAVGPTCWRYRRAGNVEGVRHE